MFQFSSECTEASPSTPQWSIDLFRNGFTAHLVSLALWSVCLDRKNLTSLSHACDLWLTLQKLLFMLHPVNSTYSPGGLVVFTDGRHCRDCKENPKPPQGEHKEAASGGLHPGQGRHSCNCWYAIFLFSFLSAYLHIFSTRSHPIFGPFWTSLPFT